MAAAASAGIGHAASPRRVRIGGTGMALASMRRVGEAYAAGRPGLTVEVLPSLGTSGGLSAVAARAIDLALSARPLSAAEIEKGLRSEPYARTPIAFVTHSPAAVEGVTLDEVERILRGDMARWPDGTPVRLVRRDPSDADWTLLRQLSPALEEAVGRAYQRPGLLTAITDQDNADALERLPGSFGLMSIGQLRAEERRLRPLALDGVAPEPEALAAGRYPLQRTLHVAWSGEADPELTDFLLFLRGTAGQAVLSSLGYLPPV